MALSRLHAFDYLTMQCLALLGVVAGVSGELRTMRTMSDEALAVAADQGWEGSRLVGGRHGDGGLLGPAPLRARRCRAAHR